MLEQLESMPEQDPKGFRHWGKPAKPKKSPLPVVVRFTADDGIVWTVWDTTFSKYKHHRRAHGDPDAKERVFVNAAGVKRSYTFKRNESRILDPVHLEQQLRAASFVGEMPDLSGRLPR